MGTTDCNNTCTKNCELCPPPCAPVEKQNKTQLTSDRTFKNLKPLRTETWPRPTTLQDKVHGPVEALQKTTSFIHRAELQV
ncbi:hypothetical protein V1264_000741 [Littorina saxatilis]|uniref:Uncharacterized protein n=1 Tax=Littorina saxatilis TaxID=31220 RepID=A0AAN9C0J3_9CAEN